MRGDGGPGVPLGLGEGGQVVNLSVRSAYVLLTILNVRIVIYRRSDDCQLIYLASDGGEDYIEGVDGRIKAQLFSTIDVFGE